MQLFYTDARFTIHGQSRPNVPFLCDETMALVDSANAYLRHVATVKGRTRSPRTWQTYANHLYEFFSFLESNHLNWNSITAAHIAAWRDGMCERGCADSTVNQRIRGVAQFYTWSSQEGYVANLPFRSIELTIFKSDKSVHGGNSILMSQRVNELTLATFEEPPKYLLIHVAAAFIDSLPTLASRLMGYLCLLSGLRREEATTLSHSVLPNPCGLDSSKQVEMRLDAKQTRTKGSKTRVVMVPYDLAAMLWRYFCDEWPRLNRQFQKKYRRSSKCLFLSEYGEEFSIRYLNNGFQEASKKTGINCNPHKLRHTYATYELIRMSKSVGQTKALLWLRDRLGHSSIKTTEMYLHTAALVQNRFVDDYQSQVLEAIQNGFKAKTH